MRVAILAALLALPGPVLAQAQPATQPDIAATVNGQAITLAEVDAALNASLPQSPLSIHQRKQLRATVINDLIDDVVLKQFLAKNAPKADQDELEAQMKALAAELVKENRTLADYLKQTGQTEAQLRATWAMQNQLTAYVKTQVTDAQLKAYHAANRDYFDKVEVRVNHIMFRVNRNFQPAEKAAAKEKLEALRSAIIAGKIDFATAARKYSQCTSAKSGGDLGFIFRRGLPEDEPLAKAAFAMKVGELSGVIETEYGLHLVAVTDRKPGTPSVLEKCIVEVLEAYTDDYRDELVKKLRKEAQIKITLP
jgi:peptidyl-prolyl cis-trans isomerase C